MMDDEKMGDHLPVRIIPIPVQPEPSSSSLRASNTMKSAGSALGFMVNGQPVSLLPGGGGAELKLCSHPGGSVSGFTTVQIPVTLTVHSSGGTRYINTTASLTASVNSSAPAVHADLATPPEPNPIPIITGVVSGEAAQKVLNDHNVAFKPSTPTAGKPLPSASSLPQKPNLPMTLPPSSLKTKNHLKGPAAPHKLLRKGGLGPVPPPNCLICTSQYKFITELRGFMCLCSPSIALSLRNLKKKKNKYYRRSRDNNKTFKTNRDAQTTNKGPRIQSGVFAGKVVSPQRRRHRSSDDDLTDEFTSPGSPLSPLYKDQLRPQQALPQGKLVILVEDFYYGCTPGHGTVKNSPLGEKLGGPYRCIFCYETLRNNIKLMDHMKQHTCIMNQEDGESDPVDSCSHCFRHFPSPFRLQCHIEAVHNQQAPKATCRICELMFDSEPTFLWHMKTTHKPGEMPYSCQVCDFRSSFYSDVWSHFREVHADSRHLLCQYCLRVLHNNICYQQHFVRHQKKHMLSCDKCRLHFLYVNERVQHKALHHKTRIKPPQLCGLKPGTKVTVRTYSVIGGSESEDGIKKIYAPSKIVEVPPPPPTPDVPKRKAVEFLGPLLSGLNTEGISQRCVECLKSVPDLKIHFPSMVHCSLCRFITCCSTSYANHMINNHARKAPRFPTIFQSEIRLSDKVRCVSCSFSTHKGDAMANHLTERPEHAFAMLADSECTVKKLKAQDSESDQNGAFVPIHLVPSSQTSTQLSVKPLTSPYPFSFTPAMTIKILGTQSRGQATVTPLSLSQLSVVLSSLCHGISLTSRQQQMSPQTIQSWISQHQRGLSHRKWCWRTDKMAEWVLNQREQQLNVSEDVLLLTAEDTLGGSSQSEECYTWTIDFMLRHDLGLQTTNDNRLKSIQDNSRKFVETLKTQIQSQGLPSHCWGSMDELPVFINSDLFANQNPSAFQLFGSPEDRPVFDIVLSALSDGNFLPPLVFFTGTASHIPDGFPDNVLLEARQEGFTDQDRLQVWIDKVWHPHVTSQCNQESLLMLDVHRGHQSDEFRKRLSSIRTDVAFIPSGCSCRLQPLDVCVTQVLRDFLQAQWALLVTEGGLDGLGLNELALTLACWLSEVSSTLNSLKHILRRSFSSVLSVRHRGEMARMITVLTEALIQTPETGGPEPRQRHEPVSAAQQGQVVQLMLMEKEKDNYEEEMHRDKKEERKVEYKHGEERREDGQKHMQEEEMDVENKDIEEQEFHIKSVSTLRQVFCDDSDQESFHGFPDC